MLTLEVNGQLVTWPEEFAQMMMNHYRYHGIKFVVHRNCIHRGRGAEAERILKIERREQIGAFEYACGNR